MSVRLVVVVLPFGRRVPFGAVPLSRLPAPLRRRALVAGCVVPAVVRRGPCLGVRAVWFGRLVWRLAWEAENYPAFVAAGRAAGVWAA